jgi:hypothetical protein
MPLPHQVDHVIAETHGGKTVMENLACACNRFKGANIAGVDPETGRIIRLFHPRKDRWNKHFESRVDGRISGCSAIGRTTVAVLRVNQEKSVLMRQALIAEGLLEIS